MRIAVVGAGVIGLACAWRLAATGASVVVIDAAPGSGASGVAAGMLAPGVEIAAAGGGAADRPENRMKAERVGIEGVLYELYPGRD